MFVSRETIKAKKLLTEGLREISLRADADQLETLIQYAFLIHYYNQKTRLVGYQKIEDIINLLILDSLLFFKTKVRLSGQKAADVGAGAGIPSLPIKIFFGGWSLDLIEPAAKKAVFLRKIQRELKIKDVRVLERRIEELSRLDTEDVKYTLVFSRAFGSFFDLLAKLKPLVSKGGLVVFYQGEATAKKLKEVFSKEPLNGYQLCKQEKFEHSFLSHPRFLSIVKRI